MQFKAFIFERLFGHRFINPHMQDVNVDNQFVPITDSDSVTPVHTNNCKHTSSCGQYILRVQKLCFDFSTHIVTNFNVVHEGSETNCHDNDWI